MTFASMSASSMVHMGPAMICGQVQHLDAGQRAGGMVVIGSMVLGLGHCCHLVRGARFDGRRCRTG